VGKAEHISAKEYATQSESREIASQDQTITGGPPDVMPMIRVPPKAVQQVTMEKLKPIMPMKPKERLSSVHS
jgi:hypothetical protein